MSQPAEPAPGRPVLVPVIIAAVFLTIIGASIGLALGARSQDRADPPAPAAPGASWPGSSQPSSGYVEPPSPPADEPSGAPAEPGTEPCRPETQQAAAEAGVDGELTVVVHNVYSKSDVWICADPRDNLYYHANRGEPGDPWVDGRTALFLTGVEVRGANYVVRNETDDGAFTFDVGPTELRISHPRSEVEIQPLRAG